jgi:manganese/iron transport system ATP-binding protein
MTAEASAVTSERGALAPALRYERVSVRLGERLALREVEFTVTAGAFVGLIGPNGSGKSTLLRATLGVLPISDGYIEVEGRPPEEGRDAFAYLPQRREVELDLPLRVRDVVMMGRLRHGSWLRPPSRADKEASAWALERVGLAGRRNTAIGELSFGQQQRVFFARALAQEGRVILLDEPMNGVDPQTQEIFVELLAGFHADGKTIVMATHDLSQAAEICDNLCVLNQRLIAYGPVETVLTEETLQEAYGVHLHVSHGGRHLDHVLEDVHHAEDERPQGARLA